MTNPDSKNFIGTYAKIILNDWSGFIESVIKRATPVKESSQNMDPSFFITALSDRQIKDTLEGPLQTFYKMHMSAFATIIRFQTALNLQKEEMFREKSTQIPSENRIPTEQFTKISLGEFETCRKDLDQLFKQQDSEWDSVIEQAIEIILQKFNDINFQLSDIEVKEFMDLEPMSELMNRFVDIDLEQPKLKRPEIDLEQYFVLKVYLTIHSALSRQHAPHGDAEIKTILKSLRPAFETIRHSEKQVIQEHLSQIDEVMKPLEFAKFK